MAFRKHIPNGITLMNLVSGCTGLVFLFHGKPVEAALLIYVAAVFDFLDGTAARVLRSGSELGKQLDSLADVVSFGVLPGLILYTLMANYQPQVPASLHFLPYIALLLPAASALRLGKFNIDDRQTENFLGLPTPASALFFSSFPFISQSNRLIFSNNVLSDVAFLSHPVFIALSILVFCILMNVELPLFSMKIKSLRWKGQEHKYLLFLLVLASAFLFRMAAPLVAVPAYLVLSVVFRKRF